MSAVLKIVDESPAGKPLHQYTLEVVSNRISLRDIIIQRIEQEVEAYRRRADEYFQGLVQPTEAEQTLNGYRMKKHRPISIDTQVELAIRAFQSNGFFILVDDRQVDDLDALLDVNDNTRVSFVKLVPLVGG